MTTADGFSEEQKQYLQGFAAGFDLTRLRGGGVLPAGSPGANGIALPPAPANAAPTGPDALQRIAQDRILASGKKLIPEEQLKRTQHPLDRWGDLQQFAAEERFPKGTDVLAWKFHGLFYVAPAQDSFMCRLRFPGGILPTHQFRAVADLAERYGGGYADVTTRANLQIREIGAANGPALLMGLQDSGIVNRGSGADNIRNVTGTPTAGIDTQELIDVLPLCREMHYAILYRREMYGLPRKFNIAFDGGGTISSLEDTNDIGFQAVRVPEGKAVPAGVYFRLQLGGITGHGDFARDTGLLLKPEECVPVALALVRVFIDHGDRTDRKKARFKYLLDAWGFKKTLEETQKHLPFTPVRFPLEECELRRPVERHGHIGFHPQIQEGYNYVGVVLPVGRLKAEQIRGLADLADRFHSPIRLTVWQNLLVSGIPDERIPEVKAELERLGLGWSATTIRGGLVACTGNGGCKFAASNTKGHALLIADTLGPRISLDLPINIHLTGCPHSCAQHFISDIGLLGTKVDQNDDMVEGYHLSVGGGYGDEQGIGREIFRNVVAEETPEVIERILRAYQEHRKNPDETFNDFARRHTVEELKRLFEPALATI